ncbi:MAG: histidine kinase [Bacteroidetes bacterium]|nr:histidine kinase [Bacteroidota bacterium]
MEQKNNDRQSHLATFITRCILIFFTVFFNLQTFSQRGFSFSENYTIFHFNSSNGLPQNTTNSFSQSKDGFIWLGTLAGIVRFDGNSFKNFGVRQIHGLKSDLILSLLVDSKDRTWAVTEEELICIDHDQISLRKLPGGVFMYPLILTEFNNEVYMAFGESVYKINDTGYTKIYESANIHLNYLKSNRNGLYIRRQDGLVARIAPGKVEVLIEKLPASQEIYTFGDKLTFMAGNVFYEIKGPGKFRKVISFADSVKYGECIVRQFGNNEYYYVRNNTLVIINSSEHSREEIIGDTKSDMVIGVSGIFKDREDNIWLLTPGQGIYELYPKIAKTYDKEIYAKIGKHPGGTFVYEAPDGSGIWFDAKVSGLINLKVENGKEVYRQFPYPSHPWCMLMDDKRNLWFGDGSKYFLKQRSFDARPDFILIGSQDDKKLRTVFQSSDKTIWIDTNDGPYVSNDYFHFIPLKEAACLKNIYQFAEDPEHGLWIASRTGLGHRFNGKWTFYDMQHGLPTNDIRSVYPDKDGAVWVGTAGYGLCRIKDGEITQYPLNNDQINQNVWAIVEDNYGYLWMSSNQGIYRVNKQNLNAFAEDGNSKIESSHYLESDGLGNVEFNSRTQNKAFRDTAGFIWFSGVEAPIRVNPKKAFEISHHQRRALVIDEIDVNGSQVQLEQGVVEIQGSKNGIHIAFAVPTFYGQSNMHFQYKMTELNEHWTDIEGRSVRFSELPPGEYLFELKLVGSNLYKSFYIKVHPDFLENIWVRYLIAILIASIPFALILRVRHKRQRKLNMEKETELELSNLKLALVQSQMNPHFIYNVLGSIQSYVANSDPYKASDYIAKFARLIRITLNYASHKDILLSEEMSRIQLYLELEKLRHGNRLNYIVTVSTLINARTAIPNMLIQPLLENAIIHGILPLDQSEQGTIHVVINRVDDRIIITVEDNGVGYQPQKSSKHGYESIGLSNIRTRIRNIAGASFSIVNKNDPASGLHGTLIEIVLPEYTID